MASTGVARKKPASRRASSAQPKVRVAYQGAARFRPRASLLKPFTAQARQVLAALKLDSAEVDVLLTDDASIAELNGRYRGKERPTDVLSFSQWEGVSPPSRALLGDVVISVETASRRVRWPLEEELLYLLIHGVLHLIGYDHATTTEKRTMFGLAARTKRKILRPRRPS